MARKANRSQKSTTRKDATGLILSPAVRDLSQAVDVVYAARGGPVPRALADRPVVRQSPKIGLGRRRQRALADLLDRFPQAERFRLFDETEETLAWTAEEARRSLAESRLGPEPRVGSGGEGLTLLTPTGDRPEAFRLCEQWMSRQTYTGRVQWIVVDDGQVPTRTTRGQECIRRPPQPDDPEHTLCKNLRQALPRIKYDKILVIEDDDYYGPSYLETMSRWLDRADLVGEVGAKYYYLASRSYHVYREHQHASLCRTGFSRAVLPLLKSLLRSDDWRLDLRLWSSWAGSRYRHVDRAARLSIGIKGVPGRPGVTWGTRRRVSPDLALEQLAGWLGDDALWYLSLLGRGTETAGEHGVVYTAIFGDSDRPRIPAVVNSDVRYVLFSDRDWPADQIGPWELRRVDRFAGDPRLANRRKKILAHRWFPEADWSLYLDGNLKLACDPSDLVRLASAVDPQASLFAFRHDRRRSVVEEAAEVIRLGLDEPGRVRRQIERYRAARFRDAGLLWGGCLLRRGRPSDFEEAWWHEVINGSVRDQLSLPYAIAHSGVRVHGFEVPLPFGGRENPIVRRAEHC